MYLYGVTFAVEMSNGDVRMHDAVLQAGSQAHDGTDYSNKAVSCEHQRQYLAHSPISSW